MQTDIKNIQISEIIEQDTYKTTFLAYDKTKNKDCYLTIPNIPTSWTHSIEY
jgi:hypothetical protein